MFEMQQRAANNPRQFNAAEDTDPYEKFVAHTEWVKNQDVDTNHQLRRRAQDVYNVEVAKQLRTVASHAFAAGFFLAMALGAASILIWIARHGPNAYIL